MVNLCRAQVPLGQFLFALFSLIYIVSYHNILHFLSDLGCLDKEGFVYIKGRISSAERFKVIDDVVYPSNVEHALRQCPKIAQCAVSIII